MKVIFGSVIYSDAVIYAADFLRSLNNQTDRDFSLLLINDGVSPQIIDHIISKYNNDYEILGNPNHLSPVKLRVKLIEEAYLRKGNYLILGDIDDYFSDDRIEKVKNAFLRNKSIGFVYNDLRLFNGKKCMPEMPVRVNSVKDILEYNFLGLSNTAIKMNDIDVDFIVSLNECSSFVFDWYLFSRLVLNGKKGIYVSKTVTYYRIHEDNYAGIPQIMADMIDKELFVKRMHYNVLSKYDMCFRELFMAYENNNYKINSKDCYFWWNLTRRAENEI